MSPVLTASVEAPPAPRERPGYLAVAMATFLGYLFTAIAGLILVLLASSVIGIGLIHEPGAGRGLFIRYDVWSWAAEACTALLVVPATAVMVGHQLRTRTGWEVGFGTLFLTLLLAGYAPGLALTPLYGATGVVSLVVATIVIRRRARPSGAEPRTLLGELPARLRRPVAIAVAVAVPAMVLYVLGYAATHPLRDGGNSAAYARDPGALERFRLDLENGGRAAVTDLSIVRVEGSPALQFERAGVPVRSFEWNLDRGPEPHEWPLRRLSIAELRSDGSGRDIELELRQGPSCTTPVARLDALWVRYTVLGMRHEQRIPLVDGPAVRCR